MNYELSTTEFAIALVFVPILLAAAVSDLRRMRIPNALTFTALGVFAIAVPFLGFDAALWRAAVGLAAFGICFTLFAVGWLGGGDAKILPASILAIPPSAMPLYLFCFSLCMLAGMMAIWAARQHWSHSDATWVSMRPGALFPMGISIAAAVPVTLAFALAI